MRDSSEQQKPKVFVNVYASAVGALDQPRPELLARQPVEDLAELQNNFFERRDLREVPHEHALDQRIKEREIGVYLGDVRTSLVRYVDGYRQTSCAPSERSS